MPRGGVPTLTLEDGTVLTEWIALLRYAGKTCTPRLCPEDPVAVAKVEVLVHILASMVLVICATYRLPKEEQLANRKEMLA